MSAMARIKRNAMRRNPLKRNARRRQHRRRPINVLASVITSLNLYCGIASIIAAFEGKLEKAAYLIFAALIFDVLDGLVARLTKSVSEFGKQFDSLCDVVSFGVAPAILVYVTYIPEEQSMVSQTGSVMAIIYGICAALRLARFNVFQAEMRENFIGLPSPAAGITIASFVLFTQYFGIQVAFWILSPITLGLAYLMVSTVPYPKDKMKSMVLAPRSGFRFLAFVAVAIAVFDQASRHHPSIVLFPLAASYCLFGVANSIVRNVIQWSRGQVESPDDESSEPTPAKTGDVL
ncbi:MAG: putative CDP-diacylglycerol--serine O-phosphatidyltransferase [Candidatus Hydrogenedentota bacterium]